MEQFYALEVTIIQFIQDWFQDWDGYLEWVNDVSSPHSLLQYAVPLVSVVDSVFAAQLLLVLSFGGWMNTVTKWWLLEDRPYWWVRETTFYVGKRPRLRQTRQTCETGPGSPSGHSAAGAAALVLLLMFISHIMQDRKLYFRYWKYLMYPVCAAAMGSIILARIYVAAHFPHQCLLGTLIGAFVAPALCIYVSDPFIWRYGPHATLAPATAVAWHAAGAVTAAAIGAVTYGGLRLVGVDPQSTVKLAFRWCEQPEHIHVSTTPVFALVQSTASLLGWALCVTPAVAHYRHYTPHRSLVLSALATGALLYVLHQLTANIDTSNAFRYYACHFALNMIKPPLLLRVTPTLAMWPFTAKEKLA